MQIKRKMKLSIISLLLFFIGIFFVFSQRIFAQEFSHSYIKLERQAQAVNPGAVLVVLEPSVSATETDLLISVGSAWSISTSPSNFTTSTSSLPAGVTPIPGINPTQVTGNQIKFSINNLTAGQSYGFYITGGFGVNPTPGNSATYLWNLTTQASGSEVNSTQIMVPVISSDQVIITGEVAPLSYYFSADLSTSTGQSTFSQNEEISYTITYGSDLSQSTPVTIQAEWSLGTIQGSAVPTVEVVDYLIGSASLGYDGASPVIDTINKTITWDISNLPAYTNNQTVTFKLKTKDSYSGAQPVAFTVVSRILNPTVTTDSEINQTYQYQPSPSPTPSPTPSATPSVTPTSTPQPTSAPNETQETTNVSETITQNKLSTKFIKNLFIQEITDSSSKILIDLFTKAKVEIKYGTSPTDLVFSSTNAVSSYLQSLELTNLQKETRYYFRVNLTSATGEKYTSDIFTLTTANTNSLGEFKLLSAQAVSQNLPIISNPLLSTQILHKNIPKIITNTNFEVYFEFSKPETISQVYYYLIPKQVLGKDSTNGNPDFHTHKTLLEKISIGKYAGKITVPNGPGLYEGFIQVNHTSGFISETPTFSIYVTPPIQIISKLSKKPIESARVLLYRFDDQTQVFQQLQDYTFLASNPLYSDTRGNIYFVLPDGKYKMQIDALGFESKESEFIINSQNHQPFEKIELSEQPIALLDWLKYQTQTFKLFLSELVTIFSNRTNSNRFKSAIELVTLAFFALVTTLALSARTKIRSTKLHQYLHNHLKKLFKNSTSQKHTLHGRVLDKDSETPISQARIVFIDHTTAVELLEEKTNAKGLFHVHVQLPVKYILSAPEYIIDEGVIELPPEDLEVIETFYLQQKENISQKVKKGVAFTIKNILSVLFEVFLLLSIGLQFLFIKELSLIAILPFLLLSILNLTIWLFYLQSSSLYD